VLTFYVIFFNQDKTIKEQKSTVKQIDNSISPYINQGLTVEILRIRHRGLMDKMFKFGIGWRNKPNFYWITNVDGKECNSLGNIGSNGIYSEWDTITQECRVKNFVEEEQEISDVTITIMEKIKKGILGIRTAHIEQEKIHITYDYRTGRWSGDDNFKDSDGYGHYVGETYEVWFNLYQSDYDHDGIPYWTEVNILNTDPTVDDSVLDQDNDGIPTSWEWKWDYDPFFWDDHSHLDPDIDGIENIEEYFMRKWFADPYQPDIYIETDGMKKRSLIDLKHVFFKDTQQMIIERFIQHGINVYIDDGWPDGPNNGGGELLPFVKSIDDVEGGQVLGFYQHNFADERKGIFRYIIIANELGWCISSKYNYYDTILVGSGIKPNFKTRLAFTPRYQRVGLAKGILHELGHSFGLLPTSFKGNDIMAPIGSRWPNMSDEEYEKYLKEYHSIMNYKYIFADRKLFDFSDGSNGPPYDQNDWDHIYLPSFQIDAISFEEPVDETFNDIEVVDEHPGIILEGWHYDENLTNTHKSILKNHAFVKNVGCNFSIYFNDNQSENKRNIRVYAMPMVYPTYAIWSLVAEGNYNTSKDDISFYSIQQLIDNVTSNI
jgi:hypothetical protein